MKNKPSINGPSIGASAFWDLPEVKAQQEIQKVNPYGSKAHKDAYYAIKALADNYGAASFFPRYEDV